MGARDKFRNAKPGTYGNTVHQAAKRMVDIEEAGKEGIMSRDRTYRKEKRAIFDGMSGRVYMGDIGGDFQSAIRAERYRREDERKK